MLTGGVVHKRHWHGYVRSRCRGRKEKVEIGLLDVAVNKGNLFRQGEREGEICGYHTLTCAAFTTCNREFHISSLCDLIGVSPAWVWFPASPCYVPYKGIFRELVECVLNRSAGIVRVHRNSCGSEHFLCVPAHLTADQCLDIVRDENLRCLWTDAAPAIGIRVLDRFKGPILTFNNDKIRCTPEPVLCGGVEGRALVR